MNEDSACSLPFEYLHGNDGMEGLDSRLRWSMDVMQYGKDHVINELEGLLRDPK